MTGALPSFTRTDTTFPCPTLFRSSKSDAAGLLRNWWTDADRKAFDARGDALVAQYNAFCPLDEGKTCVNGRLTLGENIGDVGVIGRAHVCTPVTNPHLVCRLLPYTKNNRFLL